jgi:hypothetical protein
MKVGPHFRSARPRRNDAPAAPAAGGNSATLEINVSGASGGTFVAAAHLGGIHSGDLVTAILDHAHTTAQLHAAWEVCASRVSESSRRKRLHTHATVGLTERRGHIGLRNSVQPPSAM